MKTIETDVLIIGGGLAGLTAAISAHDAGASNIIVACRSIAGKSGSTLVSGASLSVYLPDSDQNDSSDLFTQDLLRSGAGINDPKRVASFVHSSREVLPFLEANGVSIRRVDGKRMVKKPGGHSSRRYYSADIRGFAYLNRGLAVVNPLRERAQQLGIHLMDNTAVLDLCHRDGEVFGARCIDRKTGEILQLRAKCVVLASGGGASLFENTNNTTDVACDSYRLAYEAGAELQDMEFVQFFPCMMFKPIHMSISSALFGDGAVLRNRDGEAFMHRYSKAGNAATRDVMARAIKLEIDSGRGTPEYVYVDCTGIAPDILKSRYAEIADALKSAGVDIQHEYIPVAPAAHFYIGGVRVDAACKTNIRGLLSCGEATGGLHGANRLAGVALSEAVVTGQIAGQQAAAICSERKHETAFPEAMPSHWDAIGGIDWDALTARLRHSLWKDASLLRNREGLEQLQKTLSSLAATRMMGTSASLHDILAEYRYRSYLEVSSMLAECALLRRESRGAHYRTDFQESDPAYLGSFLCRQSKDGLLNVSFSRLPSEGKE